jgi:magnesium transporter
MARQTATLTNGQPHGPVASALKWAFKTYFRTRDALGDVVADARNGADATSPTGPAVTDGSARADGTSVAVVPDPAPADPAPKEPVRVSWVSSEGLEPRGVDELGALLGREDDGFVWVDIPTLDQSAERLLTDVFKFHPLAVRDCREPNLVPKVHVYSDHLFIVLHTPEPEPGGKVQHRELNQFIGPRYLVTVHERLGAAPRSAERLEPRAVHGRIEAGRARPGTPAELSYAIVTRLAVRMEELVSRLAVSVAALEQSLLENRGSASESVVDEMFELRHALLAVETIADQNQVVCARTATLATRFALSDRQPLLADALDQFKRVRRLCEGQKDLLQGVLDFTRTRATAKMDRAMSRLALLSAVALPVSVISSVYGMNLFVFQQTHLEILAAVLAAMAVLTFAMLRWARNQGWH